MAKNANANNKHWELATTSVCSNNGQKQDVGNDGPLVRDGDCLNIDSDGYMELLAGCFIKTGKTEKISIRENWRNRERAEKSRSTVQDSDWRA